MKIVERIAELCKDKKITLSRLSEETGAINIYRWDDHIPAVDKVIRVADYFGCSVDYLCGRASAGADGLSPDALRIARAYMAASAEDRQIVELALRRYEKDGAASAS